MSGRSAPSPNAGSLPLLLMIMKLVCVCRIHGPCGNKNLLIVFRFDQPQFEIEDREKDKGLAQGLPVFDWTVRLSICKLRSHAES